MEKSEKMAIGITIIVVAVLAGIVIVPQIVGYLRKVKQRREDPVIFAIQEGLGEDVSLDEFGSNHNVSYYEYLLNTYEKNVIAQLETTLNNLPNRQQNKISVAIYDSFPGGLEPVFLLKNFLWQGKMTEDGKFTYLNICYCELGYHEDFFRNPEIYTALTDIRYLRIEEPMQKLAEEAGIDWYEVWPNLETAESYTRGETGDEIYTKIWNRKELERDPVISAVQQSLGEDVTLCYYDTGYYDYLLNTYEKDVISQLEATLNGLQNQPQNKSAVGIYDRVPGDIKRVFVLQNFSWQGKMTEDGKFTYLEIGYCERGYHEEFFQNPEIYTTLSDVRHLRIEASIQVQAEDAGIDWYEVWPKLESAEVYSWGETGDEIIKKILRKN